MGYYFIKTAGIELVYSQFGAILCQLKIVLWRKKVTQKKRAGRSLTLHLTLKAVPVNCLPLTRGCLINDDLVNSLKAGERGATLFEDFILREKITHFDHERIPERIEPCKRHLRRMEYSNYMQPMGKVYQGGIS